MGIISVDEQIYDRRFVKTTNLASVFVKLEETMRDKVQKRNLVDKLLAENVLITGGISSRPVKPGISELSKCVDSRYTLVTYGRQNVRE